MIIFGDDVRPRPDAVEVGLIRNRQIMAHGVLTAVDGDGLARVWTKAEPACLRPGNSDARDHDDEYDEQPAT